MAAEAAEARDVEVAITTITGQTCHLRLAAGASVHEAKGQLEGLLRIPAAEQKLLEGTQILEDDLRPFAEVAQRGAELLVIRQPRMNLSQFMARREHSGPRTAADADAAQLDHLLREAAGLEEPDVCLEITCHANFGRYADPERRTDHERASLLVHLLQKGLFRAFESLVQHEDFGRIPGMLDQAVYALHTAASTGLAAHCQCLLESPDFNAAALRKPSSLCTPLHHAANADILRILLRSPDLASPQALNAEDRHGCTVLHYASTEDMCRLLLSQEGFSAINHRDHSGQTALHCAKNAGICAALLEHGAECSSADNLGRTALHSLSLNDSTLEALLTGRTDQLDINALDKKGRSALHYVATEAACTLLFGAGFTAVNAVDSSGLTALHMAKTVGVVRAIVGHPGFQQLNAETPGEGDGENDTALSRAARRGKDELVVALLQHPGHDPHSLKKAAEWAAGLDSEAHQALLSAHAAAEQLEAGEPPQRRHCALL